MPSNAQLRKYDDAKFKILAASYSYGGQDLEALFRKVDTDGGGDLQFEEFRRACRTYLKIGKQQLPDHELQELFTYIDSLGDGDGNLSIDEILDFIGDKLPQHMIDARERKRLEEERARQAELDAKDADAARQREFEDKRRNANQAVLLKFRVAVKTVRALIRWNNIYMGTRSRGTVFILRSIESGPSVVRELEQVMKQLWFKSVSATSLGSMWETFSQRVKDGKVQQCQCCSCVLVGSWPSMHESSGDDDFCFRSWCRCPIEYFSVRCLFLKGACLEILLPLLTKFCRNLKSLPRTTDFERLNSFTTRIRTHL